MSLTDYEWSFADFEKARAALCVAGLTASAAARFRMQLACEGRNVSESQVHVFLRFVSRTTSPKCGGISRSMLSKLVAWTRKYRHHWTLIARLSGLGTVSNLRASILSVVSKALARATFVRSSMSQNQKIEILDQISKTTTIGFFENAFLRNPDKKSRDLSSFFEIFGCEPAEKTLIRPANLAKMVDSVFESLIEFHAKENSSQGKSLVPLVKPAVKIEVAKGPKQKLHLLARESALINACEPVAVQSQNNAAQLAQELAEIHRQLLIAKSSGTSASAIDFARLGAVSRQLAQMIESDSHLNLDFMKSAFGDTPKKAALVTPRFTPVRSRPDQIPSGTENRLFTRTSIASLVTDSWEKAAVRMAALDTAASIGAPQQLGSLAAFEEEPVK